MQTVDPHKLMNPFRSGKTAVPTLAEELDLVGLLALETFVTSDGLLLFNEIAPDHTILFIGQLRDAQPAHN